MMKSWFKKVMIQFGILAGLICGASPTGSIILYAQRSGSAAKGGSPVRDLIKGDLNRTEDPKSYRKAIQILQFDYDVLFSKFVSAKQSAHPPTFKKVILVYLVTRDLSPTDVEGSAQRVLRLLGAGNDLDKSFRLVFGLPAETAKRHRRAAERELSGAVQRTSEE